MGQVIDLQSYRTRRDMRAYQLRSSAWVVRQPQSGLFLDMGLGKTISVLSALEELLLGKKTGPIIVIAPKRVAETVWDEEVAKWAHTRHLKVRKILGSARHRAQQLTQRADIYVINVDNVGWLATTLYAMEQQGQRMPFNWLVVDESSMFKNHDTKRFRAMRALLPIFERRTVLTGTPTPNTLLELWPQIYILDQGQSLGYKRETFVSRYFEMDYETGRYVPKPGAEQRIAEAISHLVLRLDNSELGDEMPEVVVNEIKITLPAAARRIYDEMERQMFVRLDKIIEERQTTGFVRAVNMAVLVGKCHQIANGAVFDSVHRDQWHEVHEAKLDALEEVLDEISGNALVAYGYRHDRERIIERFEKRYGRIPIIGAGNKDTAQVKKEWNLGQHKMVLMHPKSAMYGLNMQLGGHDVIWFSNVFSLEQHDQLIARLTRLDQESSFVTSHCLVASETTDVAMRATIRRKARGQMAHLNALKEYQLSRNLQ